MLSNPGTQTKIGQDMGIYFMVGDIYRYTYRQIRVYLPVHLAAIASIDS